MDVSEQRYVDLFNAVNYFAFGTLWKIQNSLWKMVVNGFVSKDDSDFHPAVSLGREKLTSLYQSVPMLLGSHSHKKGFPIHNFSHARERAASFFKIKPYFVNAVDATGSNPRIKRNDYKPRLEQEEISELKKLLAEKGIRYDD